MDFMSKNDGIPSADATVTLKPIDLHLDASFKIPVSKRSKWGGDKLIASTILETPGKELPEPLTNDAARATRSSARIQEKWGF